METLETMARAAKRANSFRDYIAGSATAELQEYINKAEAVAEKAIKELQEANAPADRAEKVKYLLERYKTKKKQWLLDYYTNEAACPSIMIAGASNFPVNKKNKQNAKRDALRDSNPDYLLEKIKSIKYNANTIYSDDPNAIDRLKEKIETETDKTNIRRLKERLLELDPKSLTADKKITINGKEATYNNIIELFNAVKPRKNISGDYYLNFNLVFVDEKRKYEQYDCLQVNENATEYYHYANKWQPLTEAKKFGFIIAQINGSGNKAIIYRTLKELAPKSVQRPKLTEITINEDTAVIERNSEQMRLQLLFDSIPAPETRQKLKANGFKWSPTNKAWQRLLNDSAEYALKRLV